MAMAGDVPGLGGGPHFILTSPSRVFLGNQMWHKAASPLACFSKQSDPVASFRPWAPGKDGRWGLGTLALGLVPSLLPRWKTRPREAALYSQTARVCRQKSLTFCHSLCKGLSLQPATSVCLSLCLNPTWPAVLLGHCFFIYFYFFFNAFEFESPLVNLRHSRAPD